MTHLGPERSGLRRLAFTVVTWSLFLLAGSISAEEEPREPCVFGDPRGPEGELRLYPVPTQNGTAGVRVFEDEQGRSVQRIFYSGGTHREIAPGRFSAFLKCTEEGLVPYRIEQYEYDEAGRRSKVRYLGGNGELNRYGRYVHVDGGYRMEVFDAHSGRKLSEIHVSNNRPGRSILRFDENEEVITIQGRVPAAVIPQNGWGDIVHGVRYALTAESKEAPLDQMKLYGTLQNLRSGPVEVALGSSHWLEVRDEEGRLVSPSPKASSRRGTSRRTIRPGEAYIVDWGDLREWFPDLKPGLYRVTAWHELPEDNAVARSTEMEIRVLGPAGFPPGSEDPRPADWSTARGSREARLEGWVPQPGPARSVKPPVRLTFSHALFTLYAKWLRGTRMSYQSRLSSKGQVTIPVEVREKLHLEPGDRVVYEVEDDQAVIRRAEPIDVAFHAALSETLDEWASQEDDEAFRDL